MTRENRRLKDFLNQNLYSHPNLRAERKRIVISVTGLFRFFMAHPRSLPASYHAKSSQEPLHRVVCDYIAGMTDGYLLEQYRQHVGE
jgi:dGTPase